MRIAFVLNNLSGGGAERVAVLLANAFSQSGHDVCLVLNFKRGPYCNDVSPRVNVIELGLPMLWAWPRLIWTMREQRFDVALTILDQPSIACLVLGPLFPFTKIVVVECNNPLESSMEVKGLLWRFIRALRPVVYQRAHRVVAKSDGIKKQLVDRFNCKSDSVVVIPNPIDLSRLRFLQCQPPEVNLPRPSGRPVVVGMGRLSVQKDFSTLIEAVALLKARRPIDLLILGEGEQRTELEALISQKGLVDFVRLVGFVSNPYSVIARCDVFVLSSRWEGWPNALVEALACRIRVVSTDCETGPRDILKGGKFGRLVRVQCPVDMAAAIEQALEETIDVDALESHLATFSTKEIVKRYLGVLEEANAR